MLLQVVAHHSTLTPDLAPSRSLAHFNASDRNVDVQIKDKEPEWPTTRQPRRIIRQRNGSTHAGLDRVRVQPDDRCAESPGDADGVSAGKRPPRGYPGRRSGHRSGQDEDAGKRYVKERVHGSICALILNSSSVFIPAQVRT